MSRTEYRVGTAAVGANGDLEPARFAGENARAEIKRRDEDGVGYANRVLRDRASDNRADAGGVIKSKGEIIIAMERRCAVSKQPLISEGCAERRCRFQRERRKGGEDQQNYRNDLARFHRRGGFVHAVLLLYAQDPSSFTVHARHSGGKVPHMGKTPNPKLQIPKKSQTPNLQFCDFGF